jgi:hypothetical protein
MKSRNDGLIISIILLITLIVSFFVGIALRRQYQALNKYYNAPELQGEQ